MKSTTDLTILRKENDIILFDGVCNFCNDSVQFVIKKKNKSSKILFASLQQTNVQTFLEVENSELLKIDSILLITQDYVYTKSSAALQISKSLNGLWPLLSVFLIIPKPIRDIVYDFIAKRRYQWFGKRNNCMIPSEKQSDLFIS